MAPEEVIVPGDGEGKKQGRAKQVQHHGIGQLVPVRVNGHAAEEGPSETITQDEAVITPDRESLKRGGLNLDKEGVKKIVMPREILDMKRFNSLIFEAFESFQNKYEV